MQAFIKLGFGDLRQMWTILFRTIPPLALLGAGVVSIIFGAKYHFMEVTEEQEIEISLVPPPVFGQPEGIPFEEPPDDPDFGGPPDMMFPPPMIEKIKEKVIISHKESEPATILEITVGGLALLESGELRRTYSGDRPSLCPT